MEALYFSYIKNIIQVLNTYGLYLSFLIFFIGTVYSYLTWAHKEKRYFLESEAAAKDFVKEEYGVDVVESKSWKTISSKNDWGVSWFTALPTFIGGLFFLIFANFYSGLPSSLFVPLSLALVFGQRIIWLDSKHQSIFNIDNYGFMFCGLFFAAIYPNSDHLYNSLWAAIGMGLFLFVIVGGYQWIRKQEGFGEGDIVLLFGIIPFLGWYTFLYVFIIACLTTLLWAGLAKLINGREGAISFGPGLIIGWISGLTILFSGANFL